MIIRVPISKFGPNLYRWPIPGADACQSHITGKPSIASKGTNSEQTCEKECFIYEFETDVEDEEHQKRHDLLHLSLPHWVYRELLAGDRRRY